MDAAQPVMEVQVEQAGPANLDAFLQTGRTGRRNALPDIRSEEQATVSTADLPCSLEKLSCSDDGASTSGNSHSTASSSSPTDTSQTGPNQS